MKHGWKNLVGLSLMVLTVAACGGKKGGGDGGTAAAPPATGTETPPTDGIPETGSQHADINPGTWSGRLNITDNDAYTAYMKKVLKCKGTCTSSTGYMKVRFDVFSSRLPSNRTSVNTESKVFCNQGRKTFKFLLKGRTATSNTDGNGFQLAYFLSGRYSNLNIMDSETAPAILAAYGNEDQVSGGKLQFVLIYTDATRTAVTGRVYYKGTKIAEGAMSFDELDYREFGQFYDDRGRDNDDDGRWGRNGRDDDEDFDLGNGNGRNRRRIIWRNGNSFNDGNFRFDLFFKSQNGSGFFNMNF